MTRAVRDRILKDASGNISDHLRNHIHLTNCIHLKHHMHKHSPILTERSIMRDLVLLQRSRPLKDPSASPLSCHSPSVVDLLSKRGENDAMASSGRRSMGMECQRNSGGLYGNSPHVSSLPRAKFAPGDVTKLHNDRTAASNDRGSKSGIQERRRIKREEASGRNSRTNFVGGKDEYVQDGKGLVHEIVLGKSDRKDKKIKQKERYRDDIHLETLFKQFNEIHGHDDIESSDIHLQRKHTQNKMGSEETEAGVLGYHREPNGGKRRRFQGERAAQATIPPRDPGTWNEVSVASNSVAKGSSRPKYHLEEGEGEYADQSVTKGPKNGCGIPWNWSRIHHRGKTILDMAGRSLSCGLSDSKLKKGGPLSQGRDFSDMPVMSDDSNSSPKPDAEALPLLVEGSGSQGTTDNTGWVHDYSGELGIFADDILRYETDPNHASEDRSGPHLRGHSIRRHQSLTQKYMPRTFKDLVGQSLVAQALSNAVLKRKVGLLYVFYGPHGTGKTSCARIFARALNCMSSEHPKPCGVCNSCFGHHAGKSRNIREVGLTNNFDFQRIMGLLDKMLVTRRSSEYSVFIFDDCDSLSPDCWTSISGVIDRAPLHVVFVLICSSLDVLPHIIISRCQKFFFPKLKDTDIIYSLQWIANKEGIEINKDALKLIASRSDGSLRDAEMTLEQLSLLGQRISVSLVQELVGLISDERLIDLLDLALSADTINTVKNLRDITESGIEPLALMSQLATVITDILAGSFELTKERRRRKFFRRQELSGGGMEKLRQALKILSEAEKQLRMSNDRLTWLTAALLQLAPDQHYVLPSSSSDTSIIHSPSVLNSTCVREILRKSNNDYAEITSTEGGLLANVRIKNLQAGTSSDVYCNGKMEISGEDREANAVEVMFPEQTATFSADTIRVSSRLLCGNVQKEIEEIWLEVLEKIQINGIKEFMYQEGKLLSVTFGAVPTVQLIFNSHLTKSMAERYSAHIVRAFESVLGAPATIEIRCESKRDERAGTTMPSILPSSEDCSSQMDANPGVMGTYSVIMAGYNDVSKRIPNDPDSLTQAQLLRSDTAGVGSEIVEIAASPEDSKANGHINRSNQSDRRDVGSELLGEGAPSLKKASLASLPERRKQGDRNQNRSLVRSKVSLAHVIQRVEGRAQRDGWSRHKAVSIAEKREQENLRLEPISRSVLCWKASRATCRKLSCMKIRTRKPQVLLKFVSCGKCLSTNSPR